jgi:uncharacterized protein (TIGR03437 family)
MRNALKWNTVVCHKETVRVAICSIALALGGVFPVPAQTQPQTQALWRKVGGSSVELMLAAPATGPVDRVWFSSDGVLYAQAHSGKVFQTSDFETWLPATQPPDPTPALEMPVPRQPEPGIRAVTFAGSQSRIYGLGRQLFRSLDGGHSWDNLTAYGSQVVIGPGQHSVAVSPVSPDGLAVANDFGVWRSMDGGLSWSGLNQFLPALSVRRILATPGSAGGTRVQVDGWGVLELPPGGTVWYRVPGEDSEAGLRQRFSAALREEIRGQEISAVGSSADGNTVYAGASDGRIWVSINGGPIHLAREPGGGRVERIYVDPTEPRVALAALSGKGPHVLRTTNYGNNYFWDRLDGNLPPDAAARAVTADRLAGAVYVATDKGVFWARSDLENASLAPVNWTSLSASLPDAPATDVRLDPARVQLYAALDGFGVYATATPVRTIRIVNTADFSTRAAAPGSLLSVIGGRVSSARGGNLDYPVLQVLGDDSQIQVPFGAVGPSVNLSLQTNNGLVTRELPVQPVSPAILVGLGGVPMLFDADSGLPLDFRNGAHSNGRLQIWATGLGKVRPDWPAGIHAPMENVPAVVAPVRVYLDGSPVQVTRSTLLPGYVGFYLIEVQMPSINNFGTSELYVSVDGQESNRVQMVIER